MYLLEYILTCACCSAVCRFSADLMLAVLCCKSDLFLQKEAAMRAFDSLQTDTVKIHTEVLGHALLLLGTLMHGSSSQQPKAA